MKINKGEIVHSMSGARIRVGEFIVSGGQGDVYFAQHMETGEVGILKMYMPDKINSGTTTRIEKLVADRLDKKNAAFVGPTEAIIQKSRIGHFSRRARGVPLDQFLYESEPVPYIQYVLTTLAIMGAFDCLHSIGWVHGDVHPGNIFVYLDPISLVPRIEIIDFDNYRLESLPLPPALGQQLYLAPELRQAVRNRQPAIPNIGTENYALGLLVQEGLLLKHPAIGHYVTPDEYEQAMSTGRWPDDPMLSARIIDEGFPPVVLDCQIASLFRRAHSLNPLARPTSREWRMAISNATAHIHICDVCKVPYIADASKRACALCGTVFPTRRLVIVKTGKSIALDSGCVRVGRPEFDGEPSISSVHAVFRQFGPEVIMQPLGLNGVYKKENDGLWRRILEKELLVVERGDALRFGNCDARIE